MAISVRQNTGPVDNIGQFDFLLEEDERVLWQGGPKKGFLLAGSAYRLVPVIGFVVSVVLFAFVGFRFLESGKFAGEDIVYIVIAVISLVVTFLTFMVSQAEKNRSKEQSGDNYALTDRRLIFHKGGKTIQDIFVDHDKITSIELIKKRGKNVGNIFFHQPGTVKIESTFLSPPAGMRMFRESPAFKNIENPEEVLAVVQRARSEFLKRK